MDLFKQRFTFCLLSVIVVLLMYLGWAYSNSFNTTQQSLQAVDCWFTSTEYAPKSQCYRLTLPEQHNTLGSNQISIPVVVFSAVDTATKAPPLLHLGGGGPGAAMWLDDDEMVELTWLSFYSATLMQGRDLILIDPRGAGLSVPSLNCELYRTNQTKRFAQHLTLQQSFELTQQEYRHCIAQLKAQGIALSAYNSSSVVQDIELLRQALGIETWSLYGVSYGAVYAQLLARHHPHSVEAMILDSAAFIDAKLNRAEAEYYLAPYLMLENYCQHVAECNQPLPEFTTRLSTLVKKLNQMPITLDLADMQISDVNHVVLDGNLLINAIVHGLYSIDIYASLEQIVLELEQGNAEAVIPFVANYIWLINDPNFADVSMMSHFCYEEVPFWPMEQLQQTLQLLPEGHIRDLASLQLQWPDTEHCHLIGATSAVAEMNQPLITDIPTLFLQGDLDVVTPMSDLQQRLANFSNAKVERYKLGHGVVGVEPCASSRMAAFLRQPMLNSPGPECKPEQNE